MVDEFCLKMIDFHVTFRDILHGTNGFTSLPKERVLRIFFTLKNPTASAGFEPANLGTKGQQATSRPPKPLGLVTSYCCHFLHKFPLYCHSRRCTERWLPKLQQETTAKRETRAASHYRKQERLVRTAVAHFFNKSTCVTQVTTVSWNVGNACWFNFQHCFPRTYDTRLSLNHFEQKLHLPSLGPFSWWMTCQNKLLPRGHEPKWLWQFITRMKKQSQVCLNFACLKNLKLQI